MLFGPVVLTNNRGESLLTVTIAMAIVGIAAIVAMPALMGSRSQVTDMRRNSFCRDLSQNILAQIRSNGLQTKAYRAPSTAASISFNDGSWRKNTSSHGSLNAGGVVGEHGMGPALDSVRWPNQKIMEWNSSSGRFVSNGPRLLYSAMNLLQALNNSSGNQACRQPEGIPINAASGLEGLLSADTLAQYAKAGYKVDATIKTVPFNVADETDLPCNSNLRLRPFGDQEPPRTDFYCLTDGFGTRYSPTQGIRAEVFVTLDHIDPAMRGGNFYTKCSSSEKFQYNRVLSRIPFPQFDTTGNVKVTLTSPPATAGQPRRPIAGRFLACTYEYQINGTSPFSPGRVRGNLNRWVPCEQVRVCGGGAPRITESEFQIEYQFDRKPAANCNFSMRVMAFDAVGNSLEFPSFLQCWGSRGCCEEEGTPSSCGGGLGRPSNTCT